MRFQFHLCKVLVAAGAVSAFTLVQAEPWPVWRGDPAMTGVCKETLPFPLKLAWKFPQEEKEKVEKPGDAGKAEGAGKEQKKEERRGAVKATAVSDGERFYIGDGGGKFYALGAKDGKPVWTWTPKEADSIEGSALLVGGQVIFGTLNGTVFSLDAKTGKETWFFKTEAEVRAAPNVFERPGQPPLILIGSYDNNLYALNSQDGKEVWKVETGNYVNGSAAVVDGLTAFGGCDGYIYFVNALDGKESGKMEVKNPIANTVAARNGLALLAHYGHEVVALEPKKLEPKWVYNERDFEYFASPAVSASGFVFVGDRGKRMHCLNLTDGNEKWSFRTKGRIDSSAVVTGENIVFGCDDGKIYGVGIKDGSEVWSYEIGQPIQSSPCISGGRLVMGADDGVIYCFEAEKK